MEGKPWDKAEFQGFNKLILQGLYFIRNNIHIRDFLSVDGHLTLAVYGSYK